MLRPGLMLAVLMLLQTVGRQSGAVAAEQPPALPSAQVDAEMPSPDPVVTEPADNWVDRTHNGLHSFLWRSAMRVDRWCNCTMATAA